MAMGPHSHIVQGCINVQYCSERYTLRRNVPRFGGSFGCRFANVSAEIFGKLLITDHASFGFQSERLSMHVRRSLCYDLTLGSQVQL